ADAVEHVDRRAARELAVGVSAHAVGDDPEGRGGEEAVFVVGAYGAHVAVAGVAQANGRVADREVLARLHRHLLPPSAVRATLASRRAGAARHRGGALPMRARDQASGPGAATYAAPSRYDPTPPTAPAGTADNSHAVTA